LPCADLGDEAVGVVDPSVRALAARDTDLDFDHVKSAGVLGGAVDRKIRRASEDLVEGAGRADRQIILHDANTLGVGTMYIDEFVHSLGVIFGGLQ
jgi:hypothetical protein